MHTMLLALASIVGAPPAAPFEVISAKPLPEFSARFVRTDGWTGSDGAYSIPLGPKRTLWLFGDTWIGRVENGKRVKPRMINNSAAWQELGNAPEPMRFFWDESRETPGAILRPQDEKTWHWPGDGAMVDGKLYLFVHVLRHQEKGAPGFQFDWFADELWQIANPEAEPTNWRVERGRLPDAMHWGNACYFDGEYLNAYGSMLVARPLEAPLGLARIHRNHLAKFDPTKWAYRVEGGRWSENPKGLDPVVRDGASELSVQKLRGIDGLVMVNIPLGLGSEIAVRQAAKPEGPWSAPIIAYRVPKQEDKVYVYAGKGHSELATKDGQMIITYCRNIGELREHISRPALYAPQVVEIMLKQK
jgi:hypothetical protein